MSGPDDLVVTDKIDIDIPESGDAPRVQLTVEQAAAEIEDEDDISSKHGYVATEMTTTLHRCTGWEALSIKTIEADSQTGNPLTSQRLQTGDDDGEQ